MTTDRHTTEGTQEDQLEFTLLMPCLDEAETVGRVVDKALAALERLGLAGEVLVADNGSVDGSPGIAEARGARVVHVEGKGYGSALLGGIEAARGRHIIMADADDSYDWSAIDGYVEALRAGHALVMGCRFPRGGGRIHPGAMPRLHRLVGTPVLTVLARLLFGGRVRDINCGMRGFSREAIRGLDLRATGMEFASEMVVKAAMAGLSIAETPVELRPDGRTRPPHLRTFHDGWRHLRFLLLCSPTWLFLAPGLLLFALGAAGFLLLLPGPLEVGGVALDVNTLLVCALLVLVGVQCICFGMFGRVLALTEGFLPKSAAFSRLFSHITLETGLVAGALLALAGAVLLLAGIVYWGRHGFGPIPYQVSLRLVTPSVTLLATGTQVIFSSFFLSMLGLNRR